MAAIYSNGSNRWNTLGFNFTKRDALSSVYKISMVLCLCVIYRLETGFFLTVFGFVFFPEPNYVSYSYMVGVCSAHAVQL
jgi:hypothetical protein